MKLNDDDKTTSLILSDKEREKTNETGKNISVAFIV